MAKIYNVLRYVDDIKPNLFTDDTKVQWLNEVEGYIQTEVMMLALADVVQYDPEAHMHTDLLVKPPHDKLYALYLCAMIDFANGEYDKYANTMQLYNEFLGEYIGWYTLHFRPADGGCVREGYYLSAYAIAVAVNGFEGTEKEWLEHLKGAPGRSAYEDAVAHGYTGTEEEFGRDQASFAENATAVRQMREQAEAAASSAAGSAENARQSANNASSDANSAETAATEAAKSASDAKESAQNAVREVSSAADQALRDIESAADAEIDDITAAGTGQIQRIETAAGEAEAAAARAKSSASSASSASMSAMDYSNQASRHSATASVYAGQARTSASNAETSANNATASKNAAETASEEAKSAAERAKEALGLYPTITLTPLTVEPGMPNAFLVTVKNADGTTKSETIENGVNGITPNIGSNGNWWIGGVDTGVLARGVAPTISVERDDNEGRVDIYVEDGKGGAKFVWVNDGRPGVHVGSDAPPAGTRVWVNPSGKRTEIPRIDDTLTKPGYAADAKAVGDKFVEVEKKVGDKRTSMTWYGTTSTEPYTAEKVVTTETGDFQLVKGARVGVKFLTNTVNCNSLIVDGADRVFIRSTNDEKGEANSSSTATPIVWHNLGQVQWFTYDGEYFIVDDSVRATAGNQLCGKVSVSDSVNSTGDTVASSKAVKTAYDKAVDALNAVTALDTALAAAVGSGVIA